MTIKDLKIRNFRCMESYSLQFGSKATVLFGKNGSGKTTLIAALRKALSFTMYSDIVYKNSTTKGSSKNKKSVEIVRSITQGNSYLKVQGYSRLGDYNNHENPLIEIEADAELESGESINWCMSAYTNKNRLRTSEFIDAFRTFYNSYKATNRLPLLAYYSDSFPHKEDSKKASVKNKISELRNFGYIDWDAEEGYTKEWVSRLESNFLNISTKQNLLNKLEKTAESKDSNNEAIQVQKENIQKWEAENVAIEECIKRFSEAIAIEESSFKVIALGMHSEFGKLCVVKPDGTEILFSALPAGYKRLFSIVLDLAYRAYILSEKVTTNLKGIAIIDEIDLHLHPELENVVLPALISTFPNVQFIVSTHSYGVLTNLDTSNYDIHILKMSINSSEPYQLHDIYGLDPNSTLQEVMDVTLNGTKLQRMIAQCAYMIHKGFKQQADILKASIMSKSPISKEALDKRINEELLALS